MTYAIQVADRAGLYLERDADDFGEALRVFGSLRRAFPGKVVVVINRDRADVGCEDGLTEDEREAIEAARGGVACIVRYREDTLRRGSRCRRWRGAWCSRLCWLAGWCDDGPRGVDVWLVSDAGGTCEWLHGECEARP